MATLSILPRLVMGCCDRATPMSTLPTSTKQAIAVQGRKVLRVAGIAGGVGGTIASGADDDEADASVVVGVASGRSCGSRRTTVDGSGVGLASPV
ncbi:hypothetical protein ACLOJK_028214 [Asimina triloba]